MNARIVQALVLEDWIRVRRWYPWVLLGMLLYAGAVHWLDGYFLRSIDHVGAYSGLALLERNSGPPAAYFLLAPFLAVLLSVAIIGVLPQGHGMSLSFPTRYMTLPVSTLGAVLVQAATRCVLVVPLGLLFVLNLHAVHLIDQVVREAPWLVAPLIGVLAALAVSLWWSRLEYTGVILWLAIPFGTWLLRGFVFDRWSNLSLFASVLLPLAGVVLGALWSRQRGALEGQDFSPVVWLRGALWRRGAEAAMPRVIVPFRSPGAAVRWAENPGGLGWPLGLALAVRLVFQCAVAYTHWGSITILPWLPWTPEWVKVCSHLQEFGRAWFAGALDYLPVAFMICMPLQGLGALRRNLLRLPLAARLPMSAWDFAVNLGAATLGHVLISYFVAVGVLYGGLLACSEPNIGVSYLAASAVPNSAHFNHITSALLLGSLDRQDLFNHFLVFPLTGWALFWPVNLLLFAGALLFSLDLLALAGITAYAATREQRRERPIPRGLLALFVACVGFYLHALVAYQGHDLEYLFARTHGIEAWELIRLALMTASALVFPVALVWTNIRLRSHL